MQRDTIHEMFTREQLKVCREALKGFTGGNDNVKIKLKHNPTIWTIIILNEYGFGLYVGKDTYHIYPLNIFSKDNHDSLYDETYFDRNKCKMSSSIHESLKKIFEEVEVEVEVEKVEEEI